MNKTTGKHLFLLSLLILFFELSIIRWTAANIYYVGYFTNFILLAAMLGIGLGCMGAKWKVNLFRLFPFALFLFMLLVSAFDFEISVNIDNHVHFGKPVATSFLPLWLVLPVIFVLVTALFAFLSQPLGTLFRSLPPLQAYTINILGSLTGIAAYTLISLGRLPALIWFAVALGLFLLISEEKKKWRWLQIVFSLGCLAINLKDYSDNIYWSPYYKIQLSPLQYQKKEIGSLIRVNGIGHQNMLAADFEHLPGMYHIPYSTFEGQKPFENVLLIGAGSGTDIAVALSHNVMRIDAVEIDPVIVDLGKRLHPSKPFDDPRVTVSINDGRAFLQRTTKKYDMIAFALPDSLTLSSAYSSLRLENYLFTLECFRTVKKKLSDDGVFVLYNYYREQWYVQKLAKMLEEVFEQKPRVIIGRSQDGLPAVLMSGPRINTLPKEKQLRPFKTDNTLKSATDEWPFTYLQRPTIPKQYFLMFGLLIPLATIAIFVARPRKSEKKTFYSHFFFMGAGFFLLETKSLVQFALLFGTTWLVNSLVFFAILLTVLLANFLVSKFRFKNALPLAVGLGLTLVLNFFLPLDRLMFENWGLRYIAASAVIFSPIFFANLLFARFFRDTQVADLGFACNLLGALVGGVTEYVSLIIGYRYLIIVVGIFYALALITSPWKNERGLKE